MNYSILENHSHPIVECLPGEQLLSSEQDALELVAACGEAGTDRLLLAEGCLSPAFFDLRSGLAGAVLLKLSMYRVRTAAVVPPEQASAGRFGEMVQETNRGTQFRLYSSREEAVAWLGKD